MDDISKHKASNFWFGFALGITASGAALYLLGTEKGREALKKIIDFAEKTDIEKVLEEVVAKFEAGIEKTKERAQEHHSTQGKQNSGLHSLIDKIESFSSEDKKNKRFFVKE